jgi:hypothetical protein
VSISIELLISLRQHGESHFELVLTEAQTLQGESDLVVRESLLF